MAGDDDLSDREREVLALLMQGHEVKSIAAALDLSVHSVNERLRDARRKMGASSSREAARRYFEGEGAAPQIIRDRKIGLGAGRGPGLTIAARAVGTAPYRPILIVTGVALMLSIIALAAALSSAGQSSNAPQPASPAVVSTSPKAGATISPGPFTLSVTFDRPMHTESYSFVQVAAGTFPQCEQRAQLSADHRTYSMRCTAEAGRHYEVWFNHEPYLAFRGEDGTPSQPQRLLFQAGK